MYTQPQLQALLDAARLVVSNESNEGCADDLTVTSLSACTALKDALAALAKEPCRLHFVMHDHRHGVSSYAMLVTEGVEFGGNEAKAYLVEEFEEDRDESVEVVQFKDSEVSFAETIPARVEAKPYQPHFIGAPIGRVLFPNGRVAYKDADDKVELPIVVSVYELENQSTEELEHDLAERATGSRDGLDCVEHFVTALDKSGGLVVMVVGVATYEATESGPSEPVCQRCGSDLGDDGFCPDSTCAYSDWLQVVPYDDLTSLSKKQIEQRHDTEKRVRAPG